MITVLSLITYDLHIINIQITQAYITHMACRYSTPERAVLKKKKNMRYYCKQSLIFELIFECLQICWIFNHHIHISKCFIYGRYCSFTIENTSICFAITLYINCGQRTPFIYVMILTCFHITSYCSNYSNLIMSL